MKRETTKRTAEHALRADRFDDFRSIVEQYQSLVWSIAYATTGDASLSEDVAQETFLAAWNQQADIREQAKLKSYLASIARNLGRKAMRKAGRDVAEAASPEPAEALDARAPLDHVLRREELSQVYLALEGMPEPSREAFVLFYADGQSISGVATDLELSQSAVKQRLYRARESLKDSLEITLSEAVTSARPGKAFAVATMAIVLSRSTAAVAGSAVSNATTSQALQGLSAKPLSTVAKVLGTVLLTASAATILLSIKTAEDSVEPPPNVEARMTPESPKTHASMAVSRPRRVPSLSAPKVAPNAKSIKEDVDPTTMEILADRIRERWPSADLDGDGHLGEHEIMELRDRQEDEIAQQILDHWQDKPYAVTCRFVGPTEDGQTEEGWTPYNLYGLRARFEEESQSGLGMDVKQWLTSKVATAQEKRVCFELVTRYHDEVHELRAQAQETPLPWVANVTFKGDEPFRFPPPEKLREALENVETQDDADTVANQWGVQLLVLADEQPRPAEKDGPLYIAVSRNQSDVADWDELRPSIQAAIRKARARRP